MSERTDLYACFEQVKSLVKDKHQINLDGCGYIDLPYAEKKLICAFKYVIDNFDYYWEIKTPIYVLAIEYNNQVYIEMFVRESIAPELTSSEADQSRAITYHMSKLRIEELGGSLNMIDEHHANKFGWRVQLPKTF